MMDNTEQIERSIQEVRTILGCYPSYHKMIQEDSNTAFKHIMSQISEWKSQIERAYRLLGEKIDGYEEPGTLYSSEKLRNLVERLKKQKIYDKFGV